MRELTSKMKDMFGRWFKGLLCLFAFISGLTCLSVIYIVVQEVGVVHQFFFPKVTAIVDDNNISAEEDWVPVDAPWIIPFQADDRELEEGYVLFKGIFWGEKELTNHADSSGDVLLRIKDEEGKIIKDDLHISQGECVAIKGLKNNEKYFLEMKDPSGEYILTFS